MGIIIKYKADGCFLMDIANAPLAAVLGVLLEDIQNIIRTYLNDISLTGNLETKLPNNVTVYRNIENIITFLCLFNKFSNIFKDIRKVVDIPKNEWMNILL